MENLKQFYEKCSVYLTRPSLETLQLYVLVFCALSVFFLNTPEKVS